MTTETSPTHNQPEYSVSEISGQLKRAVESQFSYVRVRGEISGFKRAASGHLYMDLKDDKAVLNSVCWKGVAGRIECRPQDGLEVIATGKLTTYAGRSNYQLVIDKMEPAGEGALMALLEQRKKQLHAEGLFDADRKQELPYLPRKIGVVTSPTGAVIRDILHRISDRFPMEVLVAPVRVQGKGSENEIAAAIKMFNIMDNPPDIIIVARGGGSLEDLWAFNEEVVVRAAADSMIPLISAVGHETDTTLIDYASDKRAPTPTAAAEMAVPVREELLAYVEQMGTRSLQAILRQNKHHRERVAGLARGLPKPESLLAQATQRLDDMTGRFHGAWDVRLERARQQLNLLASRLVSPAQTLSHMQKQLATGGERLEQAVQVRLHKSTQQLTQMAGRVRAESITQRIATKRETIDALHARMHHAMRMRYRDKQQQLSTVSRLLDSLNYQTVLERGFALVKDTSGNPITSQKSMATHDSATLQFHDGEVGVRNAKPQI